MIYLTDCPLFLSYLLNPTLSYEKMCANPKYKSYINNQNGDYFDCG